MVLYPLNMVLLQLPSGILAWFRRFGLAFCNILEKNEAKVVLPYSAFNMCLGSLANYCSRDVDLLRCTSSWSPCDFKVGEMSMHCGQMRLQRVAIIQMKDYY